MIDLYSVKPVDADTLREAAEATGRRVVVVEDHWPEGGLGETVLSALAGEELAFAHLAVREMPGSGKPAELLAAAGIDADAHRRGRAEARLRRGRRTLRRLGLLRLAVLAASAPALAACDGKNDDAKRAVDSFNSGNAPVVVREFLDKRGATVSSCRIAVRPDNPDHQLLTIITNKGNWLQATIDPEQTLNIEDVTEGGGFDPQTEAELRKRGEACAVSATYGTLTLR